MNTQDPSLAKQTTSLNEGKTKPAFVFWFLQVAILIVLDQITKYWAFATKDFNLLPGVRKYNFENVHFAFSLPLPGWLMGIIYAIVLMFIALYLLKNFYRIASSQRLAWALIVAGALSNVGERILRGSVRDFVYLFSGIFNLADGFIIAGIVVLLLSNKSRETADKSARYKNIEM